MLNLCGANDHHQLGEESNNKDVYYGDPIIKPSSQFSPRNFHTRIIFELWKSAEFMTTSCRVFESKISGGGSLNFKVTESLKGIKISEVSGVYDHCLAVSEDGRVFGCGSNSYGQLGIGKEKEEVSEFVEISSLSGHRISHAYAGYDNSLFQTADGELLECGDNIYGQLFSREPSIDCVYLPVDTGLSKNATFCVSGLEMSAVFIGHDPIQSPNRRIIEERSEKE